MNMSSKTRSSNRFRKNNTTNDSDDDDKKNNERTTLKDGFGQRSCERTHPHRHHQHRAKKKMKKNKSGERVEEEEDIEGENNVLVVQQEVAGLKKFSKDDASNSMTVLVRNPLFKRWTKDSIAFDGRTFRVANESIRK